MSKEQLDVLVVGATGSVGRLVIAEAIEQGHRVSALLLRTWCMGSMRLCSHTERTAVEKSELRTSTMAVCAMYFVRSVQRMSG